MIAGQAKSHCVAWTIEDLLADPTVQERRLEEKVYLLEDCTSPVVVPGSVDYTDEADAAFARFAEAGAHLVRSDVPMAELARRRRRSARLADELEPRVRPEAAADLRRRAGRPSARCRR